MEIGGEGLGDRGAARGSVGGFICLIESDGCRRRRRFYLSTCQRGRLCRWSVEARRHGGLGQWLGLSCRAIYAGHG